MTECQNLVMITMGILLFLYNVMNWDDDEFKNCDECNLFVETDITSTKHIKMKARNNMAIDFDALDLVRTKNKAKRHEAIKQQQREHKEKNIKYFMNQLSEIKRDHDSVSRSCS